MFFISVIPPEIRRFKFTVSWLRDDHIAAETFVLKRPRHRAMTTPSSRCRRSTVFNDWRYIDCLPRVGRRFADGDGYRSKEPIKVSNVPFPFLRAAVPCVERANPSSLFVSIMWFSCELGPLIWGIGACNLRAQLT
jgi:hypothetical protein